MVIIGRPDHKEELMARVIFHRDGDADFELDAYWWELYMAEARGVGWTPAGWNPVLAGTQTIDAEEAAHLADALDEVLARPPSSDAMAPENLSKLIAYVRRGAFTREVQE
ncbi:MAG TPA: hypothetical protein VF511_00770 [Chthoniobacterales bacterium]